MQLKTTAPSDEQTLSEVFSQMLTNDTVNQTVDDTAVLDTGIGRGNVVKYSSASGKWVLCDGTVKLNSTDTVGIVEYASGTSGQVRTSGVYLDATLTSTSPYYCQSNGTLGITVTKAFMGCIASSGRFMMVSGSGGSVQQATTENLGAIMVGAGLGVTAEGKLHTQKGFELFTTVGTATFTVPDGVTTVYVTGCGGGGGSTGGYYNSPDSYYGASGGGGAACIKTAITVVPGQSYTITIGAGGSAGTNSSSGGAGGATSFGALLSLAGGGGGSYSSAGGVGGSAGGVGGSAGLSGNSAGLSSNALFGYGGSCIFGSHTVYKGSSAGVAGSNYGSGGAGGYYNQVGAAGSQGFILVEW